MKPSINEEGGKDGFPYRTVIRIILILIAVILAGGIFYTLFIKPEGGGGGISDGGEGGGTGLDFPDFDALDSIPFDQGAGKGKSFMIMRTDSSNSFGFPPAADQGSQGACTAFSVAYGVISYYESRLLKRGYDIQATGKANPNYVFSPSFVFNALCKGNCQRGIKFSKAFTFIRKYGVCSWNDHAFEAEKCKPVPGTDVKLKAKEYLGYNFYQIPADEETIQEYVTQGFPVIIGIYTSSAMYRKGLQAPKDEPYHWKPSETDLEEYHAMVCTGYDAAKGRFELFNSWGTRWGQNGYCQITGARLMERCREAYIVRLERPETGDTKSLLDMSFYGLVKDHNLVGDSLKSSRYRETQRKWFKADLENLKKQRLKTPKQDTLIKELEERLRMR